MACLTGRVHPRWLVTPVGMGRLDTVDTVGGELISASWYPVS